MKQHVPDALALLGGLLLILAGFTVNVTVGLVVAGALLCAAALLIAKTGASAKFEVDDA